MAIEIEDGTGKSNADSFATVAEARTYASARGVTLSSTDSDVEQLLIKAADYLFQFETRFQGFRTYQDQRLPWPRAGVLIYGFEAIQQDEIPPRLKDAQMRLAMSAASTELRPDGSGQEVLKEKLGPLETEYRPGVGGTVRPQFDYAMDLLEPFFVGGSRGNLRNIRG